ncbi:hypothetical protein EfmAA242_31760 (plasmid) [Enterococcus faecium]|nr:hypothetical protein EfmAA242_31760 [Enterococcus faecium]
MKRKKVSFLLLKNGAPVDIATLENAKEVNDLQTSYHRRTDNDRIILSST